jgi:hypothetical protein
MAIFSFSSFHLNASLINLRYFPVKNVDNADAHSAAPLSLGTLSAVK